MFQGLSTALTSLYAQRQGLETTGNNLANAATEGYTRQRVDMQSIGGSLTPAFFSTTSKVGLGVTVKDITRIRDAFLEARSLIEHSQSGLMNRAKDTMTTVELSFGEPGENGIQAVMAEFWAAWDDVANNPGDLATRSQVIEQAQTLAASFQQSAANLDKLATASVDALRGDINSINAMAQSIADLNVAIQSANQAGSSANALLDERDQLLRKMSDLASITVQPGENGAIGVMIGGFSIVHDHRVTPLQVDTSGSPLMLRWDADGDASTTTDGIPAKVNGGDIGGLMNTILVTVPKYQAALDGVAQKLIATVNAQHASGLDQSGNPGGSFFTGTGALDLAIDPAFLAPNAATLIAAAQAGGGPLDGENARAMAELAKAVNGPDTSYRQLIDVMGVEAQRANRQVEIQDDILNNVDSARLSISGVNVDEEMVNMIKFQKAYDASAKYLSVLNDTLESLLGIIR